jgi:hypothetical protein
VPVHVTRIGSRDMAARAWRRRQPRLLLPVGVVAATPDHRRGRKPNIATAVYLAVPHADGDRLLGPIAKILVANGMAPDCSRKVYERRHAKLTQLMLARKRWKDLKARGAYDVSRSVLVSTTDVRRSNSAAMYLALTSTR